MKKLLLLVLALAGLASVAATCVIRNDGTTEIDGDAVYGAEMNNGTQADILQHKFIVGFIDEDGEVINTKTPTQCLRTFQSGASNYFSADSGEDPDDVGAVLSRLVLDSSLKIGQALDNDLVFDNVVAIRDGDQITVTGNVENDGNDDYEDVQVCIVIFNDQDDVVIVALEEQFDLDEGDNKDFSITVTVTDDDDDSDHVLAAADAVNSDDDDKLTEPVFEEDVDVDDCTEATTTPTPDATNSATPTATATNTTTAASATPTKTPNPNLCD